MLAWSKSGEVNVIKKKSSGLSFLSHLSSWYSSSSSASSSSSLYSGGEIAQPWACLPSLVCTFFPHCWHRYWDHEWGACQDHVTAALLGLVLFCAARITMLKATEVYRRGTEREGDFQRGTMIHYYGKTVSCHLRCTVWEWEVAVAVSGRQAVWKKVQKIWRYCRGYTFRQPHLRGTLSCLWLNGISGWLIHESFTQDLGRCFIIAMIIFLPRTCAWLDISCTCTDGSKCFDESPARVTFGDMVVYYTLYCIMCDNLWLTVCQNGRLMLGHLEQLIY